MSQCIATSVNLDLIQGIRLVQALAESDYRVYVPASEEWRFQELRKNFSIKFTNDLSEAKMLSAVKLDHSNPATSIGELSRPLLFPSAILAWCRSQWELTPKDIHASFCGLVTVQRKAILESWMSSHYGLNPKISLSTSIYSKIKAKLFGASATKSEITYQLPAGGFKLWSSTRGRVFPIKAWDEDYFRILLRSQFVLCPSGDFVWSYRFFESIMCGAIPIVEEECGAYQGFSFCTMNDKTYEWSAEIAHKNYDLCMARITAPAQELNTEIGRLLMVL